MDPSPPAVVASLGDLPWTLSAAEVQARGASALAAAQRDLDALVALPGPPTVEGFLRPLDRILLRARDTGSHGHYLFSTHPDGATRTAGRELSEAADRFFNALRVNPAVYRAVRAVDLTGADPVTRYAAQKLLRELRRAGAEKDEPTRVRLLELSNEIDRTSNEYNANAANLVRSVTVEGAAALVGLPPDYVASHPPGPDGKIVLTTRYPDFIPVGAYAEDPELRRRLLEEFMRRAYPENVAVLDRLLARRYAFAQTLGYPEFASYALEDKMMGTPEAARVFLQRVAAPLEAPARRDDARLLARKKKDFPSAERLEPWDIGFFSEGFYNNKIRNEEFGVDTRALRAYLPYGAVRDGLFALCHELFDLTFTRRTAETLYHPSVEAYDVTQGGRPMGRIFLDLTPREGKFGHAACFGIRDGIAGVQLPQSALVCNFLDPKADAESARLQYSEVITFFHEFGHLLHALFSGQGPWVYTTMSNVEWDFIEAPSQLFEEWARDPKTLARFARDPDTGATIPADLLARLEGAEALGRSSRWLRQVGLSAVSLALYDQAPDGRDASATFREVFTRYFPHPVLPEYHPTCAWGHLTGYSACYYTYVWSLVIARDLLSPFLAKGNLTDPETAARYAREILTPGSTKSAAELVRSYLGRDFDFRAFERWIERGLELSRAGSG